MLEGREGGFGCVKITRHETATAVSHSAVVLATFCEYIQRLIGRPYILLARQAQIYRNISDPFGRLAQLHCNVLLYITLQRKTETIYLFTQ